MLIDRIEFKLEIEATGLLTVGSGLAGHGPEGDASEAGQIQLVQTGARGPCLHARSLKGVLLAAWPDAPPDVFGAIGDGETGTEGRLRLAAAHIHDGETAATTPRPSNPEHGIYIKTGNAIDRRRGAVEGNKLFRHETILPGRHFLLTGRLMYDAGSTTAEENLELLARALAPLREGIAIGKGARRGDGGLKLAKVQEIKARRYNPGTPAKGPWDVDDLTAAFETAWSQQRWGSPAPKRSILLDFIALTPFLIQDHDAARASNRINVQALKDASDGPILWVSSILGAVRGRAAWLAEIDRLRRIGAGKPPRFVPATRDFSAPADDPSLDHVLGAQHSVRRLSDLKRLSSVERLFGVPGWKGLVEVSRLRRVNDGTAVTLANVAIDRFSGGALDTALFHTEAFIGCRFEVEMAVADWSRRLAGAPHRHALDGMLTADLALFDELIADLKDQGLMLGHAAARGLGWFSIKAATAGGQP